MHGRLSPDPPRRARPVRRRPAGLHGRPLPLAVLSARLPAELARDRLDGRRRGHGAAAPRPAAVGRAVPPRVDLTEHGGTLLANFRGPDAPRRRRRRSRPASPRRRRAAGAVAPPAPLPPAPWCRTVPRRRRSSRCYADRRRRLLAGQLAGGARPVTLLVPRRPHGPLGAASSATTSTAGTRRSSGAAPRRCATRASSTICERELAQRAGDAPDLPFDFTGGYVGYFGYELRPTAAAQLAHRRRNPDAAWLFADRLVAVDHEERRTYLVCARRGDAGARPRDAVAGRDRTSSSTALVAPGRPPRRPARRRAAGRAVAARDRATYLADIDACRRELHAGESYEVCLTNGCRRRRRRPARVLPGAAPRATRRRTPRSCGSATSTSPARRPSGSCGSPATGSSSPSRSRARRRAPPPGRRTTTGCATRCAPTPRRAPRT